MTTSTSEEKEESVRSEIVDVVFESIPINDNFTYLLAKRITDVIGSVLGLIVMLPLFIIISFLIKIEDPKSSVFFKQTRVGKNGETFKMYKFRSMVYNAEELKVTLINKNEATGPVFKIKLDPRVTPIGKFIRKTSIDELPQLFNVLRGDMTLVGPRPPLPDEVELYTTYEKQRLCVTPGLTCLWQVSGRSNIGFAEWVEMDLRYISQRNFVLDLQLIFKTIRVLFGSKDAY